MTSVMLMVWVAVTQFTGFWAVTVIILTPVVVHV
jgi:hypothetical protein